MNIQKCLVTIGIAVLFAACGGHSDVKLQEVVDEANTRFHDSFSGAGGSSQLTMEADTLWQVVHLPEGAANADRFKVCREGREQHDLFVGQAVLKMYYPVRQDSTRIYQRLFNAIIEADKYYGMDVIIDNEHYRYTISASRIQKILDTIGKERAERLEKSR